MRSNVVSAAACLLFLAGCNVETTQVGQDPRPQNESVTLSPAPLSFPEPGTEIAFNWIDSQRGSRPWRGVSTSGPFGEMRMTAHVHPTRSLYPGCLLHCNRSSHPITESSYREIFPLAVGRSAEFVRRREDGSAAWRHQIRVTGTTRIDTQLGEYDVFVLESTIVGIDGNSFRGRTMSYWSPALGVTVYELNTGGSARIELSLIDYKRP